MNRFDRMALRIGETLASLGVAGLLIVAIFTVADITGRYAFGKPLIGYVDIAGLATAVVVSSFFPLLLLRRGNIALQLLGKAGGRIGHWLLDCFGALVTFVFFALMAWQYVGYSMDAMASGERMVVMRWPTGPWWWGVTVFIAITALAGLVVLVQEIRALRHPRSEGDV